MKWQQAKQGWVELPQRQIKTSANTKVKYHLLRTLLLNSQQVLEIIAYQLSGL